MATIQYDDLVNIERLPVDAQDVVTKVRLVIAGNRAGEEPDRVVIFGQDGEYDHHPVPAVYEYESPEHATYGATRSMSLPEATNPFLSPNDPLVPEPSVIGFNNPGSPSAVRDGDPTTYASITGDTNSFGERVIVYSMFGAPYPSIVGFRLVAEVQANTARGDEVMPPIFVEMRQSRDRLVDGVPTLGFNSTAIAIYAVPNSDDPASMYALWLAQTHNEHLDGVDMSDGVILQLVVTPYAEPTRVRVHEFYPLILNETLLESIAKRQIRLPAPMPRRVTVAGYVPPDRTHTIVGWPGGDYTGVVAQVQYELGRTVIDFEQAGAPVGLPAEAIEAARERRVAIDRAVQDATYPVRMGERL